MYKLIRYVVICLLPLHALLAQSQQKTDSLLAVLTQQNLVDSQRFQVLYHLAYWHPNSNEGLHYAQQSVDLALNLNDTPRAALGFEVVGMHERLLGNKTKALTATLKALQIYEQLGKSREAAAMYVQLGEHQVIDGNYLESKTYFHKGIKIYQQLADTLQIALASINLGEAYRLAGTLDSAAWYFQLALQHNQQLAKPDIQGYGIGNLGMVSHSQGKLEEAKKELQEAIEILTALGDPYSVAIYKADMGQIYAKQQQFNLAEQELLEAFNLVKQEQLKEPIRDISKMLADFYEGRKQYQKSLTYQKVFQVYQDSLVNRENVRQLEQIKANYEIDKRELEIANLEVKQQQQRQISYGLAIGGSILLVLAIGLLWSYRQLAERKRLIEKREQEKILLLKELNHRVKNNLQMISSLLNLQSRQFKGHPAKAALTAGKLRVEAMSLIHQKLYQEDHHTQIPIREYMIELVKSLQAAYAEETQLDFQIEAIQLDIDLAIPLALIINELVINAFKYAFEDVDSPCLQIHFSQDQDDYKLMIKDNGIGMEPIDLKTTTSFGLKLVHSLVKQLGGKIYMEGEAGSTWHIRIKQERQKSY
ncbi:MAG: histidine kinase dimerization/phosphoacceptor domain -containing protein [Flammeovirgaceae bacterium]